MQGNTAYWFVGKVCQIQQGVYEYGKAAYDHLVGDLKADSQNCSACDHLCEMRGMQ